MKILLLDGDELVEEFEDEDELQEYLEDNDYEESAENLRVIEVEREYTINFKKHEYELEEK